MLTRSSWIKIALIVLLCLVVCGGLLACSAGCSAAMRHAGNIASKAYQDASFSERGDFSVPASDVRSLEINWAAGAVNVVVADDQSDGEPTVSAVEEFTGPGRESNRMTWQLRDGVLQIGYGMGSASMFGCSQMGSKHLTLTLPRSTAESLESIDLNAASGTYSFDSLACESMSVNLASGRMEGTRLATQSLDLDVASGTIELEGRFSRNVNASLASGDIDLTCQETCPASTSLDLMSGQVALVVPSDSGIDARVDKLSGSFNCDLPGSWSLPDYDSFTCGDGSCTMNVRMTSGNVTIEGA